MKPHETSGRRHEVSVHRHETPGRELLAIWTGVVGAPLVFLAHLQIAYMLVPVDCRLETRLFAHSAAVVAIVLAAAAGLLGVRTWRNRGEQWPDTSASIVSRDRFLGAVGTMLAALILVALVAQWIPVFFIGPCR